MKTSVGDSSIRQGLRCCRKLSPTPRRMRSNGFQIAQMIDDCHSFPNIYDMLKAKVDRLVGKDENFRLTVRGGGGRRP